MRTLQAGLDLTDDGDKVIFRQFGGESSLRTLQSGHTVIRADQFDPDGWQLPEITEFCRDNDEGCATNYMSVIAHVFQRPRCMDNGTSAGDHDPAPTRSCRPRQKTTSNGNGPARYHPTIIPTSSPRFKSGKQMHGAFQNHERDKRTSSQCYQSRRGSTAWNTVDDQTVETPRTSHGVRAMRGILRHPVSGISDIDHHGTIGGHPACIATTGVTRDEGQEEQCCESSGGSVGARQSLIEATGEHCGRRRRKTATTHRMLFRKEERSDALRTMRDVREPVAAHSLDHGSTGSRDEAEQSHSAHVHREATGRDRTPPLSTRTWERDDAGHAATEPPLKMLDVQYNLRTQPGRVRCSTCGPGELRGCRREHGSHWGRRDTVPLNVQGQLKDVDQEVCLQLIYESGQRPENQITTLGLVPRQKVESGAKVTESFNIFEGFFNCVVLDSQPTKSVPCQVRLAITRNIDEMCPKRNHQSRTQPEYLVMRSVGTTRPLRGVALFDETCDLTDEQAQEATVRALQCESWNNHSWHSPNSLGFCMTLCAWKHERGALYIMILTEIPRMQFPRNSFLRSKHCTEAKGVPGSDGISDKRGPGPGWTLTFLP